MTVTWNPLPITKGSRNPDAHPICKGDGKYTLACKIFVILLKYQNKNVPTFEYERICPCSFLGQRSYYFTAPPGALCADWSFPHIRQVGLCRTVLLGTNNNYGGTTRRPDYPNGCYLERGRPLGFLNTHAGSRTFSGMQWCGLRDKGKRYVYFLANNYAKICKNCSKNCID